MTQIRFRGVTADEWGKPRCDKDRRPICRWCNGPIAPPRRTFCGDPCVHEWRLRSDSSYVREQVWKHEGGICRRCGVNVGAEERRWRRARPPLTDRRARRAWRRSRPRWEADHIVPVADGGGLCGLDNYRLLCRACHLVITADWRRLKKGP